MPWVLNRGDQRWQGMPSARAAANEPELLMRLALDGIGIAIIGDPFALPYLQRGELIEVLPDWQPPRVSAWAVFPGRRLMPARTRVLLDALIAKFTGEECRAEEEKVQTAKRRLRAAPPRTIAATVRCSRQRQERITISSLAIANLPAEINRGRSGRGPSPWSMPPRSPSRTSPSSPRTHRLPQGRAAASANRRSGRHGCRST